MSSSAPSVGQLSIPTVTVDDLRAFQAAHFPSSQYNPASDPSGLYNSAEVHDAHNYNEDYDGLGFYADGVKRTLTDDQIAMFRHSEIETLLRERRHRAEAGEGLDSEPPKESSTAESTKQSPSAWSGKQVQAKPNGSKPRPRPQKLSTKAMHVSDSDPQGRTHRRMARELDNAKTETLDLDY